MALQITFKSNEINDYLRVDPGIDVDVIANMRDAAKDEAEEFLNTDFSKTVTNDDGSTTTEAQEAPATVKDWVLNRIAEKYERRGNAANADFGQLKRYRKHPFRG